MVLFRSISFCLCTFTMELERASHLVSRGYAHFRKKLCEASVRRQEAVRAYKRSCEAEGSPLKRLFSDKQEHRWTPRDSPQSIQNGTERNEMKRYANILGRHSATLHSGFMRIFTK